MATLQSLIHSSCGLGPYSPRKFRSFGHILVHSEAYREAHILLCHYIITLPSSVLQVLVPTHRVFDYYTVYYIVAQVQLEAQKYRQHSPCKVETNISGKKR